MTPVLCSHCDRITDNPIIKYCKRSTINKAICSYCGKFTFIKKPIEDKK